MNNQTPQLLVIASSGTLAKHIVNEVITSFGIGSLAISDYKEDRLRAFQEDLCREFGKEPEARLINITSIDSIQRGIDGADYVIAPVSQHRPLVQEACINKGISCIDLSVSESFIDDTLNLHAEACDSKCTLLMAAGLFPGLSGMIAKSIHTARPGSIVDIGLVQSRDGVAGSTGIADMLQLFHQDVMLTTPSGTSVKKGFSFTKPFRFENRFGETHLRLAHFIERKYLHQRLNIESNYWSAFDSEKFNSLIAYLRKIGFLKVFDRPKYRLAAAQLITKQKQKADEEVVGIVGQTDEDNKITVLFESDYSATASCTIAFIKILEQLGSKPYGVRFPFEIMDFQEVLPYIRHRMINS